MDFVTCETSLYVPHPLNEGGLYRLPTHLSYQRTDPYAVSIVLSSGHGSTPWQVSRKLLRVGLCNDRTLSGHGDFRIGLCNNRCGGINSKELPVHIELRSEETPLVLHGEFQPFDRFIFATEQYLPFGQESDHINIDLTIQQLLS